MIHFISRQEKISLTLSWPRKPSGPSGYRIPAGECGSWNVFQEMSFDWFSHDKGSIRDFDIYTLPRLSMNVK